MKALGALSPIENARAQVQEKIADFLAARARLGRLMKHESLSIQGQARGLYEVQETLENRLYNEIFPKLQQIQAGVWDISDVLKLGYFTTEIVKQINDVNSLDRAGGGVVTTPFFDTDTLVMGGAALVAVSLLGGYFLSRK